MVTIDSIPISPPPEKVVEASEDKLLAPEEVAAKLHVTVGTLAVWRCSERYRLPYTYLGRQVRYYETDVIAFIRSRRVVPKQAKPQRRARGTRRGGAR